MADIEETPLPGVGVRYDFTTTDGRRLGVVHHRSGRREMFVCSPKDPDRADLSIALSDEDSRSLVDALGGSRVVESVGQIQQHVEGLAIDWIPVEAGSVYTEHPLGDARIRTRTGASVVAVLRGEAANPSPGPDFVMTAGDMLVVVGTPTGIEQVSHILSTG